MDSMRHLSTSLPQTARGRSENDLLSSFKAAALSVTNLYKAAASDSIQARQAGYQDALDDLLAFLDKENIGLDDGEGWAVRKWILERLEDAPSPKNTVSDDEEEEPSKQQDVDTRQSSPADSRKEIQSTSLEQTDIRRASEPPVHQSHVEIPNTTAVPSMQDFSFRAAAQLPTNHDREGQMELDIAAATLPTRISKSSRPKAAKRDVRSNNSINLNFAGTGNKRKMPYPDFFDISNINIDGDKRDGNGRGGKRGRHV